MTKRLRRGQEEAEVNITPLLDIVFIMLIFFIVTATFVDEDGFAPNLPEPSPESDTTPPPSMLLTVRANGFVQVDGGREIDPRSVKNTVSEFIVKDNKSVVIVSAEPDAPVGDTLTVLDQAREGGTPAAYNRITLTTTQSQ